MGALEAALSQVARMGAGCCLNPIFGAVEAVGNLEPTQKASPGHLENQEGAPIELLGKLGRIGAPSLEIR